MFAKDKILSEELFSSAEELLRLGEIDDAVEHKLKVIVAYKDHSVLKVAKKFNISDTTVSNWIRRFMEKGVDGLKVKSEIQKKSILEPLFLEAEDLLKSPIVDKDLELKLKIIMAFKDNIASEVAKMFNVSEGSVLLWYKRFKQDGIKGLEGKDPQSKKIIHRDLLFTQAEETLALPNLDAQVIYKLKAILAYKDNGAVEVAKIFNVGENTIFRWIRHFMEKGVDGLGGTLELQKKSILEPLFLEAEGLLKSQNINKNFELKLKTMMAFKDHTAKEVATMFNISLSTVSGWYKDFKQYGVKGLEVRTVQKIKKECHELLFDQAEEAIKLNWIDQEATRKLKAIIMLRSNTAEEVGKIFNIEESSILKWVREFRSDGIKMLQSSGSKKTIKKASPIFLKAKEALDSSDIDEDVRWQLKAIIMFENTTASEVGTVFNISENKVYAIFKNFKQYGVKALGAKTPLQKKKERVDLWMEVEKALKLSNLDKELEHKLKVILSFKDHTAKEVATMFNISLSTVSGWYKDFKQYGVKGLEVRTVQKIKKECHELLFDQAEEAIKLNWIDQEATRKLKAIIAYRDNTASEVGKRFDVSKAIIMNWFIAFKEKGIEGLVSKRILENKVLAKKAEEALKLAGIDKEIEHKLRAIIAFRDNELTEVTKVFNVSEDVIYKWRRILKKQGISGFEVQKRIMGEDLLLQAEEALKLSGISEDLELKLKMIIAYRDSTATEVAKIFNVRENTIFKLYKTFKQKGVAGLRNKKEKNGI